MTGHDDARTTMPFTLMVKGKLNFGSLRKKPFREEANPLGRPVDLLLNQIDGIRETDSNSRSLLSPGFAWQGHRRLTNNYPFT